MLEPVYRRITAGTSKDPVRQSEEMSVKQVKQETMIQ